MPSEANGIKAKAAVSVEAVSTEQKIPKESSTPAKDSPKQPEIPNMFKMFKKKTMPVVSASESNIAAEAPTVPAVETESQKSVST